MFNRIIFIVLCMFFIIFYFFLLPLPKIISEYENFKQKQIVLQSIKEENQLIEKYLWEIDNQNTESLKYILFKKGENEFFVKFPQKQVKIEKYYLKNKNIFILLYYLFGVTIFSIILINFIAANEFYYTTSEKRRRKHKFYNIEN